MNSNPTPTLYLRLKRKMYIKPEETVTLGQIARLVTDNKALEQRLMDAELYKHRQEDGNRVVVDLLQIVQAIRQIEPLLSIESYGDPQVLLMVAEKRAQPRVAVLLVSWVLLFFGSGLAIMNFHTDVGMKDAQIRIVELITGQKSERPLWFQIPYSIGIGAGMVLFFNHLFRKRFNEEPNPLEVELFMYQENMNDYVIADEMRKKSSHAEQED
ncbi:MULTISPECIES: stage V sporulation protein AA [unclassified Paenibacillus]|uniref:stage V sporulation protein AA n=1 Tax=unclassified Paenibacillus TaxID=185978 RepID=UPI002F40E9EF